MCPNKLQDHLDLQASRLTSYDQVKSEVLAYLQNVETKKEAKSGAVPMDVDSLAEGKGRLRGMNFYFLVGEQSPPDPESVDGLSCGYNKSTVHIKLVLV